MPIDFSAPENRRSYSDRDVDESWRTAVRDLVAPAGADVVDIGCGGGAYTRTWVDIGAQHVVGVDSSELLLRSALDDHGGVPGVSFRSGDAAATGLPGAEADIVFARALIHHVADLDPVVSEARRLLRPGGTFLIQDRTPDDVALPGSPGHPRGWLFEVFPHLLAIECRRRRPAAAVTAALIRGGFLDVRSTQFHEVRRRYAGRDDYLAEIAARTGRSILHELSDDELERLVDELRRRLPEGPLAERDRWTFWSARRP